MKHRLANIGRSLFLLVGTVVLVLLVRRIGYGAIVTNIVAIGWAFPLLLATSFVWYLLYTLAWRQFFLPTNLVPRFWSLFRMKLAGEAANVLTPVGFLGGDPLRIVLLQRDLSVTEGAASVVVDRTLHLMATLVVVIVGVIASFVTVRQLPDNIQFGIPIALVIAITFTSFVFIHQRRGLFSLFLSACRRLGLKRTFSERTVARFEELDSHIIDFYETRQQSFIVAFALHFVGRLLGVLEIYIAGRAVSDTFTPFAALVLCALAPMVNVLFAFVPGALGILEGAYSIVLYVMGFDPAIGVAIQIAKRLRAVFWIIPGLVLLGGYGRRGLWKEKLVEEV